MKQLALGVRLRAGAVYESFARGRNSEILTALRSPSALPVWLWGWLAWSVLVSSILAKDYLVVQAVVLLIAVIYAAVNFVVDLLYPILDPRVSYR